MSLIYHWETIQIRYSKPTGPPELVQALLSMSSLTGPLSSSSGSLLTSDEVPQFLSDLVTRFNPDGDLPAILGPVVNQLLFHESLARPDGISGADAGWRGVLGGMEALVAVKPIAAMIPLLPEWNPQEASAPTFETTSLMGPLLRLSVFGREWVRYFPPFFV